MNKRTALILYFFIRIISYAFFGYIYGMIASLIFSMISLMSSWGAVFEATENLVLYVVVFAVLGVVISFVWLLLLFLYHRCLLRLNQELSKKRSVCFGSMFGLILLPVYTYLSSLAFGLNNQEINLYGLVIYMLVMFFGVVLVWLGFCIVDALAYYFLWKKYFKRVT